VLSRSHISKAGNTTKGGCSHKTLFADIEYNRVFENHLDEPSITLVDPLLPAPLCPFLDLEWAWEPSCCPTVVLGREEGREVSAAPSPYLGFHSPTSHSCLGEGKTLRNRKYLLFFFF